MYHKRRFVVNHVFWIRARAFQKSPNLRRTELMNRGGRGERGGLLVSAPSAFSAVHPFLASSILTFENPVWISGCGGK